MAVGPETLRLLGGMRIAMLRPVDLATEALVKSWAAAWNELSDEWRVAIEGLVEGSRDGQWPSRTQIRRAARVRAALGSTREALHDLSSQLPVVVTEHAPTMTRDAAEWERALIASQMPAATSAVSVVANLSRVDDRALTAIVKRTAEQVTALSLPLTAQAEQAMRAALIRGVALGDNPIAAAKVMLDRTEDAFNGGRNRALVIARTEMLDAHREAGRLADEANADVLTGWQWVCALDRRSCPSCWAMHGRTYPASTPGPWDHQQGRCTRLPKARSWSDLGFDVDEPADLLPDARAAFDALSPEDRLTVMGSKRLALLDSGQVSLADLAKRRETPGWRPSYAPAPLSDLAA